MLKKLTLVLCSVFLFSFCVVTTPSLAENRPEKGQQLEKFKKGAFSFHACCRHCHHCCPCCPTYQASITKLDDLLTKYEKAADNKKDVIKKDIQKFVGEFLDKKIEKKKEKIAKLQALINEYTTERDKVINDKVDYLTSEKGLKKIHKQKAKIDKKSAKNKDKQK